MSDGFDACQVVTPLDEIISPNDQLIEEMDKLKEAKIPGVKVENLDEGTIRGFNQCEVQFFLAGVRTVTIADEIFGAYIETSDSDYSDWSTYWSTQAENVKQIVTIFNEAADSIPDNPDFALHRDYLFALAKDWEEGRGRSTADSEVIWYSLPRDVCKVDLRGLPKIEEGSEAYINPHRRDGGNTSLTVRIVEPKRNPVEFRMVEAAIPAFLGAQEVWNGYSLVDFEEHNLVIRGALHGRFVRATGHQYKRFHDGMMLVRIISNKNMKELNSREFLQRMGDSFSPEILEEMRAVVLDDSIGALYGHEMSEVLIENIYASQIEQLGRREAVELLATIGTIEAVRQQIKDSSDNYSQIYTFLMESFVAGCVRLNSLRKDHKLDVYLRGYNAAMKRLKVANAVVYDDENRISAINRPKFEVVIAGLAKEVFDIIKTGDKVANEKLFEITSTP